MRSFDGLLPSAFGSAATVASLQTSRWTRALLPWTLALLATACLAVLGPLYATGWGALLGLEPRPSWSLFGEWLWVLDLWLAVIGATHATCLVGIVLDALHDQAPLERTWQRRAHAWRRWTGWLADVHGLLALGTAILVVLAAAHEADLALVSMAIALLASAFSALYWAARELEVGPSMSTAAMERPVCLRVTHGDRVLLLAAPAVRADWHIQLDLPSGRGSQDLFGHYLLVLSDGLELPYEATDWVCRTDGKFGHVVQDRELVQVSITAWERAS
jgi:hypothetical protein